MPGLDMPLEQLKAYQGRNQKPRDFEAYWDSSLEEMRGMDPHVEFRTAQFQAPGVICQDLYFTGVGNARIHARFARPADEKGRHPAVLHFHGYAGAAASFTALLPYAYAGFYAVSMDVRGQGGQSQDTARLAGPTAYGHIVTGLLDDDPKALFYRSVFLDAAQLAGILMAMPHVDAGRVGCMGGSQGGALTLACAALENRIVRAAPYYPWLCDYQRAWELGPLFRGYEGIREFFRHFDPTHAREEEVFTKLGYVDVQHLVARIRGRVLMATGLMDDVCPPSTQFAAYNKITGEKSMMLYPDYGHELLPGFDEATYTFMMELR